MARHAGFRGFESERRHLRLRPDLAETHRDGCREARGVSATGGHCGSECIVPDYMFVADRTVESKQIRWIIEIKRCFAGVTAKNLFQGIIKNLVLPLNIFK